MLRRAGGRRLALRALIHCVIASCLMRKRNTGFHLRTPTTDIVEPGVGHIRPLQFPFTFPFPIPFDFPRWRGAGDCIFVYFLYFRDSQAEEGGAGEGGAGAHFHFPPAPALRENEGVNAPVALALPAALRQGLSPPSGCICGQTAAAHWRAAL